MNPVATLTSTAVIDNIQIGDRSVELIGYVDELQLPSTYQTLPFGNALIKDYNINVMRFVLNNGEGRRVECVAWGRQMASRVSALIKLSVILHIDGALATNPCYDRGGVLPFEVRIEESTIVTELGEYPREAIPAEIDNPALPLVTLGNVAKTTGRIRIHAFLKSPFRIITGKDSSYTIGVITDGTFKLEVQRAVCTPIDIDRGEPIEVTGVIYTNPVIHLKLRDDSEIKKRNDLPAMTPDELLGISRLPPHPRKKTRDHNVPLFPTRPVDKIAWPWKL